MTSTRHRFEGYAALVRPSQAALVAIGTGLGWRLAGAEMPAAGFVLVMLSNTLLFAGSMAINDWRDLAADRINKPRRPLPSGRLSRDAALAFAVVLLVLAIAPAWAADARLGLGAVLVGATSVAYSLWLKRVPALGNLIVAAVSAYPLWCWLVITDAQARPLLVLVAACIVFRLGAEIAKTAEDVAGDRAMGIATLATLRGPRWANRVGTTLMLIGLLACWPVASDATPAYTGILLLSTLLSGGSCALAFLTSLGSRGALFVTVGRAIMTLMIAAVGLGIAWS
jgi:geranylgeranylglycerol-phosphate geranylgeranyltransferase